MTERVSKLCASSKRCVLFAVWDSCDLLVLFMALTNSICEFCGARGMVDTGKLGGGCGAIRAV